MEIIDDIPVRLPLGEIRRQLHLDKDKRWEEVQALIEAAKPLIAPKAAYKVSYINQKLEQAVEIDGVRFASKVFGEILRKLSAFFRMSLPSGINSKKRAVNPRI